jgi:protein phosphatase 1 regulatory subunit 7
LVQNLHGPALTLEELYLADNGIDDDGLQHGLENVDFPNLCTLDVSRNKLTTCRSLSHLTSLTDLWLSGNQVPSFDQVEPLRVLGSNLESIYLEYNPLYQEFDYRKKLKDMIPSLEQIDAVRIDGGYGITWCGTTVVDSNVTRESILKATSVGRYKELQEKIVMKAEEETRARKQAME